MNGRYFLDTNLFVYCFDKKSLAKQKRSQELVDQALSDNAGFISTQVIQEFLNVALRKFETPLTIPEASDYLKTVLGPLCDVFSNLDLYDRALDLKHHQKFEWYDALIVAAALQAEAKILYSEDLHHGQTLEGLKIQNPFY
jgi:predicted nucleic acid-binding protein